jgi:hypothetical protein
MDQRKELLEKLYVAFNERRFDELLGLMADDVEWENGMQGGFVHGREAVSVYWRKQFEFIKSNLEILKFETDERGREIVSVHLVVTDLENNVLLQKDAKQIFTFNDAGLIGKFELEDTIPISEAEGMEDFSEKFGERMAED